MRTLSTIAYAIGSALLISSCFIQSIELTWWIGGLAVVFLVIGCIMQFNIKKSMVHSYVRTNVTHHNKSQI